jgi:hypothetical protein
MAKTFRPYEPDQAPLLPPAPSVYFVSDVVDTLDRTAIYDRYSEEGGFPLHHLLLMTKLFLFTNCAFWDGRKTGSLTYRALIAAHLPLPNPPSLAASTRVVAFSPDPLRPGLWNRE